MDYVNHAVFVIAIAHVIDSVPFSTTANPLALIGYTIYKREFRSTALAVSIQFASSGWKEIF